MGIKVVKFSTFNNGILTLDEVAGSNGIDSYQCSINSKTCQIFVKYLNQLQNLYHALTSTELKIAL